ncbi:MAG: peptide-binding protein [Firmicutes bacterium]|nr:peptide-binding protein [Bacillota bacterium]
MRKRLLLMVVVALLVSTSGLYVQAQEYGGQIIIGSIADASLLNPVIAGDSASYDINYWVYDSLIRLDENLLPQPQLATGWDISDDGQTVTFYLHEGVKWHDGEELTSADVAFTVFSVLDYKSNSLMRPYFSALQGAQAYLDEIDTLTKKQSAGEITADEFSEFAESAFETLKQAGGVMTPDKYTVVFNLEEPHAPFMTVSLDLGIIPKHIYEGTNINENPANSRPIGSGAFKFVEWRRDDRIVLEANDDYYKGRPYLDRVIYRIIPDQTVMVTELRTGGIDMMTQPPPEVIASLEADPNLNIMTADTLAYTFFGFQLENPLFQDVKVRQAISYAVDMESIVEFILLGYGQEATGPFPAGMWAYNPDARRYPYDPDKAMKMLAEAGWTPGKDGILEKDGQRFEFTLETNQGNELREQMVVIIQEQLSEIGIVVNVSILEWPTFVDRLLSANFEAVVVGWTGTADPDGYGYTVWHSSQFPGRNTSKYANDRVDWLLEEARREMDIELRAKYYQEVHAILAEEQPYVFGYFADQVYAVHKRFKGFIPTPQRDGIHLSLPRVWMEK